MTDLEINRVPIFVNEIFHFQLPNFKVWQEKIKQIVLVEENKLLNSSPAEECNIKAKRTAWNSHYRYPVLHDLSKEIQKYLQIFIDKEGYDIPALRIQECWVNWYKKNQSALPHKHGGHLSVVLFVDVEDTDAKFFFHSDDYAVLMKKTDSEVNFTNVKEVNAKNGTVLFFDGSVSHSVTSNKTDKNRISVAINYAPFYNEHRNEY